MKKQSDVKCGNCRYYQEIPPSNKIDPEPGECRFNPPVNVWPSVYEKDWCGKFVSKESENVIGPRRERRIPGK